MKPIIIGVPDGEEIRLSHPGLCIRLRAQAREHDKSIDPSFPVAQFTLKVLEHYWTTR